MTKSKPTLNLVSRSAAGCPTTPSLSAASRPEILRAHRQGSNLKAKGAGKIAAGGSNQNDAASSSQVCQRDAKTIDSARKLAAAGTNQDLSFQDCASKLAAENSKIIVHAESEWPNSGHICRAYVPHLENVHSSDNKPEDKMEDLGVNT